MKKRLSEKKSKALTRRELKKQLRKRLIVLFGSKTFSIDGIWSVDDPQSIKVCSFDVSTTSGRFYKMKLWKKGEISVSEFVEYVYPKQNRFREASI